MEKKLEAIPIKLEIRKGYCLIPIFLCNITPEALARTLKQRRKIIEKEVMFEYMLKEF